MLTVSSPTLQISSLLHLVVKNNPEDEQILFDYKAYILTDSNNVKLPLRALILGCQGLIYVQSTFVFINAVATTRSFCQPF